MHNYLSLNMTNSVVPDQTPPYKGGVWSGTSLFIFAPKGYHGCWKQ